MTRRISLFDNPFLLGFDEFERAIDRVSRSASDSYPPYNIEQVGDNDIRISIAVAGFDMDDLNVQLEHNQLIIRGKKQPDDEERIFVHRGIATRQFQRSFVLSDDIEVTGASMDNGLLNIDLHRLVSETTIQNIKIEKSNNKDKKVLEMDPEKA